MRLKAIQFLEKVDQNETNTYCFKTNKCLPAIKDLIDFEPDLTPMIKNIQFRPARNNFVAKSKNNRKQIHSTDELLVNTDKSGNVYTFSKNQYKKYICDSATKTYQKSNRNKVDNINYEAKTLREKLNIGDRLQQIQETEVFVAVKDHKVGFPFTFINPHWQNLILVNYSKYILDNNKF